VLRASLGSVTKFNPNFLRVLMVALSASTSVVNALFGSMTTRGSKEWISSAASEVLGAKLVDAVLCCPTLVYT